MKIHIETYRGQDIYFDTEKESFICVIVDADFQKDKKSYAACKKEIDDYLKNNNTFSPFEVESIVGYVRHERLRITGIRKDGRYVAEIENGEVMQISEYNEKDYILVNPDNDPVKAELEALREQEKEIKEKISETKSRLKIVTLRDVKAKYLPQK